MNKRKILIGLLGLSLLLNIAFIVAPNVKVDTPEGMYMSDVGMSEVAISIESDGNYCVYRPNKGVIKAGKYKLEENILVLDGDENDYMYYSDGNIVYCMNDNMVVFNRVDKTPGYIGIDDPNATE